MKDIDLTKCSNCRFRAKIGYRKIENGILSYHNSEYVLYMPGFIITLTEDEFWRLLEGGSVGKRRDKITDFTIIPRDPETSKDWDAGDWIRDSHGNRHKIELKLNNLVIFKNAEGDAVVAFVDELFRKGWRLVLTDIEQQIIEEKKKYKPQDGEICYAETMSRKQKFIIIYNHQDWSLEYGVRSDKWRLAEDLSWTYSTIRPATDEEKQRLFDAMANEGKRWNAEKKAVEDIPKPYEFRKG